jgi:hypothetical protein
MKATNWPPTEENGAYNDDFVVAINEVIARKKILIKKYLKLNPKILEKTTRKKDGSSPLVSDRVTGEEE